MAFNNVYLYLHNPITYLNISLTRLYQNLLHKGYLLNVVLSINNTIQKHLKYKNSILSNIYTNDIILIVSMNYPNQLV
jgi:hypothetical protein